MTERTRRTPRAALPRGLTWQAVVAAVAALQFIMACKPSTPASSTEAGVAPPPSGSAAAPAPRDEAKALLKKARADLDTAAQPSSKSMLSAEGQKKYRGYAREKLTKLVHDFPGTPESTEAATLLAQLENDIPSPGDDATIAALKASRVLTDAAGSKVQVTDVSVGRDFVWGNYGSGGIRATADKGNLEVAVSFDVQSKEKNPNLACPVFFLREPSGRTFHRPDQASLEFRRWDSYSSFLGNNPDLGNDFAKTDTIKFISAVQVPATDLATHFLYIGFRKTPLLVRHEERFHKPPVWYDVADGARDPVEARMSDGDLTVREVMKNFDLVEVRAPRRY